MNDRLDLSRNCQKCGDTGRFFDHRIGELRMCDCRAVMLPPPDTNPVAPAGIESRSDEVRLNKQQAAVWAVLSDRAWHTPRELEARTGFEWASISARLRDLRKLKYGGHEIERDHLGAGLYRYRWVDRG